MHFLERSHMVLNVFEDADAHDLVECSIVKGESTGGHVVVRDIGVRVPARRACDSVKTGIDGVDPSSTNGHFTIVVAVTAPNIQKPVSGARIGPVDYSSTLIHASKVACSCQWYKGPEYAQYRLKAAGLPYPSLPRADA
jgi:hypothetical protein